MPKRQFRQWDDEDDTINLRKGTYAVEGKDSCPEVLTPAAYAVTILINTRVAAGTAAQRLDRPFHPTKLLGRRVVRETPIRRIAA